MTHGNRHTDSPMPTLVLFVTGNAPRSVRARSNLSAALAKLGYDNIQPMEVDLIEEPEKTISFSVFATPALMRTDDDGDLSVLYGDLSEEDKLLAFLEALSNES